MFFATFKIILNDYADRKSLLEKIRSMSRYSTELTTIKEGFLRGLFGGYRENLYLCNRKYIKDERTGDFEHTEPQSKSSGGFAAKVG